MYGERSLVMYKIAFSKIWVITAIFILLSGCSRVYVSQDYDASVPLKLHSTYQWLPMTMGQHFEDDAFKQSYPFIAKRFEKAIQNHLIQRGSVFVSKSPEAYISYHYLVSETRSLEPRTSFGFFGHSRHFGLWSRFPVEYYEVVTEMATWRIGIYNKAGELVWQGQTNTAVQAVTNNMQETLENTQKIVDSILLQYPPR